MGRLNCSSSKFTGFVLGWQASRENCQRVARLMQLLVQRRQRALELRERRILRVDVGLRDGAELELPAQHGERLALERYHALGGRDLRPQSGLLRSPSSPRWP